MKKGLLRLIDIQILHQLQPQLHKSDIDTQHTHSLIIPLFYCQVANLPLSWDIHCWAEPCKSQQVELGCCVDLLTTLSMRLLSEGSRIIHTYMMSAVILQNHHCNEWLCHINLEDPKIAKLLNQIINYTPTPVIFLLTKRHSMNTIIKSSPDDLTVKASCTRLYLNGLYQINQLRLTICVTTLHVFLPPWRISLDKNHAARKQNETINH